jgi:AmpD protein
VDGQDNGVGAIALDDTGEWVIGARRSRSPNCDARPCDIAIDLVVVHGISLPPGEFGTPYVEDLFTNRLEPAGHPFFAEIADQRVSAHVLVRRTGELVQFVPFSVRAWHAGVSSFAGRERCNDFSIGIELEGTDTAPYTGAQYAMLAALVRTLMARWPAITPERVVGNCDIAPGRKSDPGPAFDWARLRAALERRDGPGANGEMG